MIFSLQNMYVGLNHFYSQVGGAALDVFEQEPPTDPVTLEIIQHKAVIATPHLGKLMS